jgi:hypothetical protein
VAAIGAFDGEVFPVIPFGLPQRCTPDAADGISLLGNTAGFYPRPNRPGLLPASPLPAISRAKSVRATNVIERLDEEFKRRIKTQTVLPSAETAAMLFCALLTAGQITMPKVDE